MATDQVRETASLYAAGALIAEEAQEFERHLQEGCEVCSAEVRDFREAASLLLLASGPQPAPSRVRTKLLKRVQDPKFAPGVHLSRASEGEFAGTGFPGVSARQLYAEPPGGNAALLVRMEPGAEYPSHGHADIEHCYVLEGDLRFADGVVMYAGDYSALKPLTEHPSSHTIGGCLLLVIASQQNAVL